MGWQYFRVIGGFILWVLLQKKNLKTYIDHKYSIFIGFGFIVLCIIILFIYDRFAV
ncbi:hypothetical protein SAMN05660903_03649 [Salegentibacter salinarum]|nr:hypothetical protein SAMN05660903_03649 [Salegentibacter salinarum]